MASKTVGISTRQANLKRRLRRHLSAVGFHRGKDGGLEISGPGKEVIRELHRAHRNGRVRENQTFIAEHLATLIDHFAAGNEIDPALTSPYLERVPQSLRYSRQE